ncbi:hypothetical protein BDF19DRAFT_423528 [Syncephalis fuscata]|nr:hypothetical protein BDF19DRAFT_423528 [Syncephalis fuscata]
MIPITCRLQSTAQSFVRYRGLSTTATVQRQFLAIAHDFTDAEAPKRRLAVRQAHLERAQEMKQRGEILFGGALLTSDDQMNGSIIVFEATDEAQVRRWIADDPYVVGRVWDKLDIKPFRLAKLE